MKNEKLLRICKMLKVMELATVTYEDDENNGAAYTMFADGYMHCVEIKTGDISAYDLSLVRSGAVPKIEDAESLDIYFAIIKLTSQRFEQVHDINVNIGIEGSGLNFSLWHENDDSQDINSGQFEDLRSLCLGLVSSLAVFNSSVKL